MKIGIIGMGMVGTQVNRWFKQTHEVITYDKLKGGHLSFINQECEIVFVCISTPFDGRSSTGIDITPFLQILGQLSEPKIVVIKSTIPIGCCRLLQSEFPRHKILHNPEFLSEKTAWNDFRLPDMQIIGFTDKSKGVALKVAKMMPYTPNLHIVGSEVSETYKLMRNSYLATKVTFFNEMYDICQKYKVDYNKIGKIVYTDSWIGINHTVVNHKGYRGFGGKCLPKDLRIMSLNTQKGLLTEIDRINTKRLEEQGLGNQLNDWVKGVTNGTV